MLKSSQVQPITWSLRLTSALRALIGQVSKQPTLIKETPILPESKVSTLTLKTSIPTDQVGLCCLAVIGELNRHTNAELMEYVLAQHRQGRCALLLDLREITGIELSGVFVLLNIARLFCGQTLLDAEEGWAAIRAHMENVQPSPGNHFKLLPSPQVAAILQRTSICRGLACYADMESALAAFAKEKILA